MKMTTNIFFSLFTQELKLKYYNLMIQVDQHEGSYLSICKHYRAIYDTPCILEDSSKWQQVKNYSFEARVYFRFCFANKMFIPILFIAVFSQGSQ